MIGGCHQAVRDLDHVRQVVSETCFSAQSSGPAPGRVGLEVEAFPFEVLTDGATARRVPLVRLLGTLDEAVGPPLGSRRHETGGSIAFPLDSGGSLTFEPGGQLEHSTAPHPSPTAALADVRAVAERLAEALLLRQDPPPWRPGRPGWTFGDWLRDGHPDRGRPSVDDLHYHLSTMFPEVRARGFLELRAVDALPARYQSVPVVLLVGLLEDATARAQVLAVVGRYRAELPELWRRAATVGLADPALCALAVETWSLALAGARRLPPGYLPADDLRRAESFLDRFTMRGRCPADELRELLERDPTDALAWAAEPVPVRNAL